MPKAINRRKLLRAGGKAIVASGAALCANSVLQARENES
jgi:hypothetical protein